MADSNKKTRVAVLMGGPSEEHEVSVNTGRNVLMYLDDRKYEGVPVMIDKEGRWNISPDRLREEADVAFVALHGRYGEDGHVQSELELVGVPYTGSGPAESALAMHKFASLDTLRRHGFDVPHTIHITRQAWQDNKQRILNRIELLEPPWVVKPNMGGSSVGITFPEAPGELEGDINNLLEKVREVIVQPEIMGVELTCGVLDTGLERSGFALPPTEIIPKESHFFDYHSKYKEGGAEEITPARLPDSFRREVQKAARDVHHSLGLRGMSRTDFILDDNGRLHVLEVNTIPGLTNTSLLPQAVKEHGMSFSEMVGHIISAALRAHQGTDEQKN